MKTVKAILINPTLKTVEIVELKPTLQNIVDLLECRLITSTYFDNSTDVLYIDDEGLFTDKDFFVIGDNPQPLAGNGIVMGSIQGEDGVDDTNPHASLEEIREMVTFLDKGTFIQPDPAMIFMSWEEAEKLGIV